MASSSPRPYPWDLTDEEWALIAPMVPVKPGGRPAKHPRRRVVEALLYVNRTGCPWRALPQNTSRWVVERTDSWHNRGFKKLAVCTEKRIRVIQAFIALANAIIITRRLFREAWSRHRWNGRPARRPRPIGGTSYLTASSHPAYPAYPTAGTKGPQSARFSPGGRPGAPPRQ